MRHNGRPVIKASEMSPEHLDLSGWPEKTVACPDCGRWRSTARKARLTPHRAHPEDPVGLLCPGSGQRFYFDLDPSEWARERAEGLAEVAKIKTFGVSDPTWVAASARL